MFHGYFVDFYYYDHGPWNPHTTLKVEFIQTGQGTSSRVSTFKKLHSNGSGYNTRVWGFGRSKEDVIEFWKNHQIWQKIEEKVCFTEWFRVAHTQNSNLSNRICH